jgi:hypothetical protein
VTFTLNGYLVKTTSNTTFSRGPCKDLKDGKDVAVHGELQDATTILALTIEFLR